MKQLIFSVSLIHHMLAIHGMAKPHAMIFVKECTTKAFVILYTNESTAMMLPNPLVADAYGQFSFQTPASCVEIFEAKP